MPAQPVDQPDALVHQLIAVIAQHADLVRLLIEERDRQSLDPFADRGQADRFRVDRIGLPRCPRRFARRAGQRRRDPEHPLARSEQRALEPTGDVPAILDRPYPILVEADCEPQRAQHAVIARRDRELAAAGAGSRIERDQRVRPLVSVHPDHHHVCRPFVRYG
jgi:hypothetical protein